MPSDLEKAMESMIMVFHKYASKDGDTNTLSRRELKDLMENELAGFLKVCSPFLIRQVLWRSSECMLDQIKTWCHLKSSFFFKMAEIQQIIWSNINSTFDMACSALELQS